MANVTFEKRGDEVGIMQCDGEVPSGAGTVCTHHKFKTGPEQFVSDEEKTLNHYSDCIFPDKQRQTSM